MSVEVLVRESEVLVEILDPTVEDIADRELQAIADSAWYRLGSVNALVRDQGGGALAASLARGLIEQAAYWDWALATGVGVGHLEQWSALELRSLSRLADEIDDRVWLRWLIPPGAEIEVSAGPAIPDNRGDAVRRLGSGLDNAVLDPLRFDGLLSAYRILDVLAHGNYLGAAILADQPDLRLPDRLAAIATHLAAAGATAVVLAFANDDGASDAALTQYKLVATAATAIHGFSQRSSVETRRPPRARRTIAMTATSSAERMPIATADMTQVGLAFVAAADGLAQAVVSDTAWAKKPGTWIPVQSFRLSLSNLSVIRSGLEGRLGKALMPNAARMLLEDGARWEWLLQSASTTAPGEALKALVADGARRRDQIAKRLQSDRVPQYLIDDVLGAAVAIPHPEPGTQPPPPLKQMLPLAYPNPSGVDSARAMYSVLSQFVHATPLSNWHIRRDTFPSLTAPTYAISLEAAARGFERIASITPLLAGTSPKSLDRPLQQLRARCAELTRCAAVYHLLG